MHLVFDIFQGIGIAGAVGIRPFLPSLAVGGLAAGNAGIHFEGTDYAFLQQAPFLVAMAVAAVVLAVLERRFRAEQGVLAVVLALAAAALGALLFAGSLARGHYAAWPGYIGGVICAAVGVAATVPLLRRVRERLDRGAAGALPAYAELAAVAFAALSVLAPPVGVIGLAGLVWLLVASRRREGRKHAGLRILR
jgi:Domain of unknown function (DUF4126)